MSSGELPAITGPMDATLAGAPQDEPSLEEGKPARCPEVTGTQLSSPNNTRPLGQPLTVRTLTSIVDPPEFPQHPLPRDCRNRDLHIEWDAHGPRGTVHGIIVRGDLWATVPTTQGAGTYTVTSTLVQLSTGEIFEASHSWDVPHPSHG